MSIYKIFETCYPVEGRPYCFHYVLHNHEYSTPIICHCEHVSNQIVLYNGQLDFNDSIWRVLPENVADRIRDERPERKETDIFLNRPIVSTEIFNSRKEVNDALDCYVGGDCWGAYLRDIFSLITKRIYFKISFDEEERQWTTSKENKEARNNFDLDEHLDTLFNDEELVIVMNISLDDIYIRKLDGGKYMVVYVNKHYY